MEFVISRILVWLSSRRPRRTNLPGFQALKCCTETWTQEVVELGCSHAHLLRRQDSKRQRTRRRKRNAWRNIGRSIAPLTLHRHWTSESGGGDLPLNLRHHPQRGFLHTSTTSTRTAPFQRRGRGTYGLRKLRRVMKWHHHGRGDLASRADLELLLRREETRIGSCGASVMSPTKAEGAEMRTNSKPCNQILDLAYPQTQIGPRERCARRFEPVCFPLKRKTPRRKSRATKITSDVVTHRSSVHLSYLANETLRKGETTCSRRLF